jgi:hypothetical protein
MVVPFVGNLDSLYGSAGKQTSVSGQAKIRIAVMDAETGLLQPCMVFLKEASGAPVNVASWPHWYDHFAFSGVGELEIPFGTYACEIDRGPEYQLTTVRFSVDSNGPREFAFKIRRLVTLANEGWWSGELHVHRSVGDIELLMEAADLHVVPLITWWNAQNAWAKCALPISPVVRFDRDRFYHLLAGEDERAGGALMFFNLNRPLQISTAKPEYPNAMLFIAEARRMGGGWIDIEKPFWYDMPVWVAGGMVDSIGIANNHMLREGVVSDEAWGRPRDKRRFPGLQGNGLWTQEIYYHILNCGIRLPPSAGSASGVLHNPVGYNRMYVYLDGGLTYSGWWNALKAGRVFVTNGPLLRCRANGELPGHVFRAATGQTVDLKLDVALESRDPISVIEVIKNGTVVKTVPYGAWKDTRSIGSIEFEKSGWFLIRALADIPDTFRFASTGPFYVEIGAANRRVSRASAQFFVDWVQERMGRIRLDDPIEQAAALGYQREAERFWRDKIGEANAP